MPTHLYPATGPMVILLGSLSLGIMAGPLLLQAQDADTVPLSKTVILDPGHGGDDVGLIRDRHTLSEKEATLLLAQELQTQLREESGMQVALTRDSDIAVSILERATIANRRDADVFISIHLGRTSDSTAAEPLRIYINGVVPVEALMRVTDRPVQKSVRAVPWDLAQNYCLDESRQFSQALLRAWKKRARDVIGNAADPPHSMPLAVLTGVRSAAVMVEIPVPHSSSANNLRDESLRQAIARALKDGIVDYLYRR